VKKILILLAVVPVILWGVWLSFPASSMRSLMEDSLGGGGISMEFDGLRKGFFYDLSADKIILKSSARELVSFDNVHGWVNPLELAGLGVKLSVNGTLASGPFSGDAVMGRRGLQMNLVFTGADMRRIPLLNRAGIRGTGVVSGKCAITGDTGRIEFAVKDAKFEQLDLSGLKVPMDLFHDVTGAFLVEKDVVEVASVSLEGRDIYARLKGSIRDRVADLQMELMPGKSFVENPFVLTQLDRYKVSPGYYVIPIRGALAL